jgi:hypothetical protein
MSYRSIADGPTDSVGTSNSNCVGGSASSVSCLLTCVRLAVRASIRDSGLESRVGINTPYSKYDGIIERLL